MAGIECHGLHKAYGDVLALVDVTFEVKPGNIVALLGTNGSGKTTTVRILTTLTRPDAGRAQVAGSDVGKEAPEVRRAIGFTAQETIIDRFFTGEEYLRHIARLRHIPRGERAAETAALVDEFELQHVARTQVGAYSGGTRRRLHLAASFIGRPRVLFLDEPSNGLDPLSRTRLLDAVRRRAVNGTTVLLTTQYMEEADALADSLVVLGRGKIIARGTPGELKDAIGGRVTELTLREPGELERAAEVLAGQRIDSTRSEGSPTLEFVLPPSAPSLVSVLQHLSGEGIDVSDVIVRRPSLDEAFRQLNDGVGGVPRDDVVGVMA